MGTAVITIRPMEGRDVPFVAALEKGHQPRPWSESTFREELGANDRVYLVAEDGGAIIGFAGLMIVGDEAHVTNLLVDSGHRRGGVGRRLMVALIAEGVALGTRHLTLEVRVENDAARALYAGLGLAPVGVRPRYYGDEDALILWAHDIDRPEYMEGLR